VENGNISIEVTKEKKETIERERKEEEKRGGTILLGIGGAHLAAYLCIMTPVEND